jgi:hypothetical protein
MRIHRSAGVDADPGFLATWRDPLLLGNKAVASNEIHRAAPRHRFIEYPGPTKCIRDTSRGTITSGVHPKNSQPLGAIQWAKSC